MGFLKETIQSVRYPDQARFKLHVSQEKEGLVKLDAINELNTWLPEMFTISSEQQKRLGISGHSIGLIGLIKVIIDQGGVSEFDDYPGWNQTKGIVNGKPFMIERWSRLVDYGGVTGSFGITALLMSKEKLKTTFFVLQQSLPIKQNVQVIVAPKFIRRLEDLDNLVGSSSSLGVVKIDNFGEKIVRVEDDSVYEYKYLGKVAQGSDKEAYLWMNFEVGSSGPNIYRSKKPIKKRTIFSSDQVPVGI